MNENIYIAVAGCRGSGKSRLLALIGFWTLAMFHMKQCVVTISANTEQQIEKSVWLGYTQLFSDLNLRILIKKFSVIL